MKVLCYRDSNTYGYDPRGFFGDRYPAECRWVDILARKLNWEVQPGNCWRRVRRIFSPLCWEPMICSGVLLLWKPVPVWKGFCGTSSPSAQRFC